MPRLRSQRTDGGASSLEYGLLISLIAALIVSAVLGLGGVAKGMFAQTCDSYRSAASSSGSSC